MLRSFTAGHTKYSGMDYRLLRKFLDKL